MDTVFMLTIAGTILLNILSSFIYKRIEDGRLGKQLKLIFERLKLPFERQFPEFC